MRYAQSRLGLLLMPTKTKDKSASGAVAPITSTLTIAPVAVAYGADAEFTDFAGLERGWSIKRGQAYELIRDGAIRSVVLRRKGRIRGRRLIQVASVRAWLAAQPTDVDKRFSKQLRKANARSLAARWGNKANAAIT
jgi:hypothetical protein